MERNVHWMDVMTESGPENTVVKLLSASFNLATDTLVQRYVSVCLSVCRLQPSNRYISTKVCVCLSICLQAST